MPYPLIDPAPRHLPAGLALHRRLDAGTRLEVLRGAVSIEQHGRWLAETMVAVPRTLATGHAAVFDSGGWVVVRAQADAQLRWWLPEPAAAPAGGLPSLLSAVRKLLHPRAGQGTSP